MCRWRQSDVCDLHAKNAGATRRRCVWREGGFERVERVSDAPGVPPERPYRCAQDAPCKSSPTPSEGHAVRELGIAKANGSAKHAKIAKGAPGRAELAPLKPPCCRGAGRCSRASSTFALFASFADPNALASGSSAFRLAAFGWLLTPHEAPNGGVYVAAAFSRIGMGSIAGQPRGAQGRTMLPLIGPGLRAPPGVPTDTAPAAPAGSARSMTRCRRSPPWPAGAAPRRRRRR